MTKYVDTIKDAKDNVVYEGVNLNHSVLIIIAHELHVMNEYLKKIADKQEEVGQ